MNLGSKYYGCEILNPGPTSYILKGGDSQTCDPPARKTESTDFETLSRPPEKN
jgi:hypothetical protein